MGDAGVMVDSTASANSLLNDLSELAVTDFQSDALPSTHQTHAGAAPIKKEYLLNVSLQHYVLYVISVHEGRLHRCIVLD